MTKSAKVLVIEDQEEVQSFLSNLLQHVGHEPHAVSTGAAAETWLSQNTPDLILLDIGLPDVNGFSLCHTWRNRPPLARVPIIIISGLSSIPDRVTGLNLGADDYLCKPFSGEELCARIDALLRRARMGEPANANGLTYRHATKELTVEGKVFRLTRTEDRVLVLLAENAGRIIPVQELLHRAWSYRKGAGSAGLVRYYISRLRRYLSGSLNARQTLQTIGRDGYLLHPNSIQLIP